MQEGRHEAPWAYGHVSYTLELAGAAEGTPVLREEMPGRDRPTWRPHQQVQTRLSVDGVRRAGVAVGRSDKDFRFHREQGWDISGGSMVDFTGPD